MTMILTLADWEELWRYMQTDADGYRAEGEIATAELIEESIELSKKSYHDKNQPKT